MMPQTYIHTFKRGLTVRVTLDPARATSGQTGGFDFCWSRRPTPAEHEEMLPEYLHWKSIILQHFADDTGLRILDLVQVGPNDWLPRTFEPQAEGGGE